MSKPEDLILGGFLGATTETIAGGAAAVAAATTGAVVGAPTAPVVAAGMMVEPHYDIVGE